jgi:hypothetical protein
MYSILKKLSLFFLFLFITQSSIIAAQTNEFYNCKLINSKDKTPLPFATILIKNKAKGLISNIDGGFKIPYEFNKLKDTLVISSIGFFTKEVSLSNFEEDGINIVTLSEKTEVLDEVILIAAKKKKIRSAKEIFKLAINKIPNNYPFTPFSYIGYYRDYQLKEESYLNLNEALMEVFDPGFAINDFKETQTRIYDFKKNTDFPIDTIASNPYDFEKGTKTISSNFNIRNQYGNEFTILRLHDAIRNYNVNTYDFVNRLNIDFAKNHQLKLLPDTSINNIPLYAIAISKALENVIVNGKIYISKGDFKIYKMQYAAYDKGKLAEQHNTSEIKEKDLGKLLYEIILEYQSNKGRMYLNYISFNNSFEVLQNPKFFPLEAKMNYSKLFNPASNAYELSFNDFEVTFNNIPLLKNAIRKNNYKLRYRDVKLKIKSITVKENKALLNLDEKLILSSRAMQASNKSIEEDITFKIKNIKDIYGNEVNKQEFTSYNQFREFFVQELKINSSKPLGPFFMLKDKPIFENQPIAPFDNLSDYWLNTPLKN